MDLFDRMSVRKKILALTSMVFVITMVAIGIVLDKIITDKTVSEFKDSTTREVVQVDNAMYIFLDGLQNDLKMLA